MLRIEREGQRRAGVDDAVRNVGRCALDVRLDAAIWAPLETTKI